MNTTQINHNQSHPRSKSPISLKSLLTLSLWTMALRLLPLASGLPATNSTNSSDNHPLFPPIVSMFSPQFSTTGFQTPAISILNQNTQSTHLAPLKATVTHWLDTHDLLDQNHQFRVNFPGNPLLSQAENQHLLNELIDIHTRQTISNHDTLTVVAHKANSLGKQRLTLLLMQECLSRWMHINQISHPLPSTYNNRLITLFLRSPFDEATSLYTVLPKLKNEIMETQLLYESRPNGLFYWTNQLNYLSQLYKKLCAAITNRLSKHFNLRLNSIDRLAISKAISSLSLPTTSTLDDIGSALSNTWAPLDATLRARFITAIIDQWNTNYNLQLTPSEKEWLGSLPSSYVYHPLISPVDVIGRIANHLDRSDKTNTIAESIKSKLSIYISHHQLEPNHDPLTRPIQLSEYTIDNMQTIPITEAQLQLNPINLTQTGLSWSALAIASPSPLSHVITDRLSDGELFALTLTGLQAIRPSYFTFDPFPFSSTNLRVNTLLAGHQFKPPASGPLIIPYSFYYDQANGLLGLPRNYPTNSFNRTVQTMTNQALSFVETAVSKTILFRQSIYPLSHTNGIIFTHADIKSLHNNHTGLGHNYQQFGWSTGGSVIIDPSIIHHHSLMHLILHEVGHVLGLAHPHDSRFNHFHKAIATRVAYDGIMSYGPLYSTDITPKFQEALRYLYS